MNPSGVIAAILYAAILIPAVLVDMGLANAAFLRWELNAKFDDGGTASGYFMFDPDALVQVDNPSFPGVRIEPIEKFQITVDASFPCMYCDTFPALTFTPGNTYAQAESHAEYAPGGRFFVRFFGPSFNDPGRRNGLTVTLWFDDAGLPFDDAGLPNAGGTVPISLGHEEFWYTGQSRGLSGQVTAVPESSATVYLALGLAMLLASGRAREQGVVVKCTARAQGTGIEVSEGDGGRWSLGNLGSAG